MRDVFTVNSGKNRSVFLIMHDVIGIREIVFWDSLKQNQTIGVENLGEMMSHDRSAATDETTIHESNL